MKTFFKVNDPDTDLSKLVNIGDASFINFDTSTSCTIYYKKISTQNAVVKFNGIDSGVPVLMDSFEQAITSNPGKTILPVPSKFTSVFYTSN